MGVVLRNLTLVLAVAALALPAVAFDGPTQQSGAKKSTAASTSAPKRSSSPCSAIS